MLTGEVHNQIDGIWNDFWSGGLANPLQVVEQVTYLIFLKRLDEMQALEEKKAQRLGTPVSRRIFVDAEGEPVDHLRWSAWKHEEPREMYALVESAVFPWLRDMGGHEGSYARHMRDAAQVPTLALLAEGRRQDRWPARTEAINARAGNERI